MIIYLDHGIRITLKKVFQEENKKSNLVQNILTIIRS